MPMLFTKHSSAENASAEVEARQRRQQKRAVLEQLPFKWALEDEQRRFNETLIRRHSMERGFLGAAAAAWSAGEPLNAMCAVALVLLVLLVRRRRLLRHVLSGGIELAEKRRHASEEEAQDSELVATPMRRPSQALVSGRGWRRAIRQLRLWIASLLSICPRFAVRYLASPKRRLAGADAGGGALDASGSAGVDEPGRTAKVRVVEGLGELCPALLGSSSNPASILSRAQLSRLAGLLPPRLGIRDWSLVYSTEQHGCSLRTFYARAERCGPSVLLVLDSGGAIFGAFLSQSWHRSEGYFGTGESFVVRVHPRFDVHRWTRKNSLFALAGVDHIALGGGGGFSLWLDSSFENGSSTASETFDNPPLGSSRDFRCVRVELWTFQ